MTLEEINDVEDKTIRLRMLKEHMELILQNQRDQDELAADEEMNNMRDEAFGMMSRFGKPGSE